MGFSEKELGDGEEILIHTRTHIKKLWRAGISLVLIVVGLILGLTLLPVAWRPTSTWVLIAAVVVLGLLLVVIPAVRWRADTFTVTNRRIMSRKGMLTRTGNDIHLRKVNSVSTERGLIDRMLHCGTLNVDAASDTGQVSFRDIPNVEEVHLRISNLLFNAEDRSDD